jgi:hypothetical protein
VHRVVQAGRQVSGDAVGARGGGAQEVHRRDAGDRLALGFQGEVQRHARPPQVADAQQRCDDVAAGLVQDEYFVELRAGGGAGAGRGAGAGGRAAVGVEVQHAQQRICGGEGLRGWARRACAHRRVDPKRGAQQCVITCAHCCGAKAPPLMAI